MSKELASKLDQTDLSGVDLTDANEISNLLGYTGDAATQEGTQAQGETAAAPAAAPAQAEAAPAANAPAVPAAPAPATESSAAPAAAAEQPSEIAGVLTKDGKHVIPNRVLQEARTKASLERQRADALAAEKAQLEQQIADLKAGRQPAGDKNALSEEQLADLEDSYPQFAPLVETVRQLQEKVASAAPAAPAPPSPPSPQEVAEREVGRADALDQALAGRALLTRYRETGGVVWGRAVEIDDALRADASFKDKPAAERFAEVEKRLAAELGVAVPASTPNPPAAPAAPAQAANAAPAAPAAAPSAMPTLTDLGGAPVAATDPLNGMTPGQMVDKAMSMDMEQLRRMAGLSY